MYISKGGLVTLALVCVLSSVVASVGVVGYLSTTAQAKETSTTGLAGLIADRAAVPAIGLGAKPNADLDAIFPERQGRIKSIMATATADSVVIFDSEGNVYATFSDTEAFLWSLWDEAYGAEGKINNLEDSLDAAFSTKPIGWVHVHENVDMRDFDGDGGWSHQSRMP